MSEESIKSNNFRGVSVMRDGFTIARNFFDLQIDNHGLGGYVIWQRNNFRLPLISSFFDFLKRRKRSGISIEEAVDADERNFFIPFDEVQGIVTDDEHKEVQILSSNELLTLVFRPIPDYEAFIDAIQPQLDEKIFNRDLTEVTPSVKIS
ncbi:MAG: hypothetical protein ACW98K_06300 [Candidatus Kariarchaeaceae archaeon]|jgi:hypothetical protein